MLPYGYYSQCKRPVLQPSSLSGSSRIAYANANASLAPVAPLVLPSVTPMRPYGYDSHYTLHVTTHRPCAACLASAFQVRGPACLRSCGLASTGLAKWPEMMRSKGKRSVILSTHARAGPGTYSAVDT